MPPSLPVLFAVVFGILVAHWWNFSLLVWWSCFGVSLLLSFTRTLRKSWILLALFFLAGVRFQCCDPSSSQKPRAHLGHTSQNSSEKARLQQWFDQSLARPYNSIALGIFLGNRQAIPRAIVDDFKVTGTYHLLVASGLKVAIVAGMAWLLLFPFNFYIRVASCVAVVLVYVFFVGLDPPVLRASFMAILGLAAVFLGKEREGTHFLFLTAFVFLLVSPEWLFNVGFQLSFLSVFGILIFHEALTKQLFFLPKWVASSFSVTVAAVLPIVIPLASYFHALSLVAPLANLITVPMTGVSMIAAVSSFFLGLLWRPLGLGLSFWHELILAFMLFVVRLCRNLPFAYRYVLAPKLPTILAYYVGLVGLKLCLSNRAPGKILFAASAIAFATLWVVGTFTPKPATITFLNVEQGDCAILQLDRRVFLIDGGGSPSELYPDGYSVGEKIVVPFLESQGVNKIDGILLTHPHQDHAGGLIAVLNAFPVKQIWLPPLSAKSFVYRTFFETVFMKRVPLIYVRGGEKIEFSKTAKLRIYWPVPPLLSGTVSDLNNNSVVSQLVMNHLKVLFSGDVELDGEAGLLHVARPRSDLWSQILKVPHHGSATSSTLPFLEAVSPVMAVISVGRRNPYHQPSLKTLKRINRFTSREYRTDQDSTVQFRIVSTGLRPRVQLVPQSVSN